MIDYTGTYTDAYQLTMAQVYFLKGQKNHSAVFDYFFRKLPFDGGYAVFSGLEDVLEVLENFHFDPLDIEFLASQGFNADFLNYLKNFRFQGTIYSCLEGEIVFPTSPILSVEANLIEAQLIETLILNILNFQTLIATKASRIRHVAGDKLLIDFGLRRAQGAGGYCASRAAIVGGFDATSNVRAGRDYHIPISGTMAHSFVQSYDNELSAFRDFAKHWPNRCVLLVDTYNTIESGIPNAIKVGKEMEAQGHQLYGIRLDSGDLASLAKQARHMLNDAGLNEVKIIVSNQLDEYAIISLMEQRAPIDVFGVGTSLAVGWPDAALDGVYKLAVAYDKPRIKLSETPSKISLPYKKQVHRVFEREGLFGGADVITLFDEQATNKLYSPFDSLQSFELQFYKQEPLLHEVMQQGLRSISSKTLKESAQYCQQRLNSLPMGYKQIINPKHYLVGLSEQLNKQRVQLIKESQRIV
ncbi:nicotinate phosphoribosyltransferase [Legionella fallonii]|uniref:nicotinate phosphoribosyltransferase n=1 Tax=Legionella fallonii TaxID=96230 RepID=UPI0005D392C1|nr:nicotinate phosphoribosyltransferase [Legionella fallonii]